MMSRTCPSLRLLPSMASDECMVRMRLALRRSKPSFSSRMA
ncbi:MAG: hypothetical protein ACI3ZX_00835 [Candidatus Aphodosoma sp.]